jgi:alkylation response protein AidB-like acyl-CoA dehydrogenase
MCLTEPSAGSDVGNLKTTARRNGDHYLISGSKCFITSGEHDLTENIIHPVLARVEGGPPGTKGISLFLIPKFLVNPDGTRGAFNDVRCGGIEEKMGIHGSPTCVLNFGDEGKCKGWLLGEEHQGIRTMFHLMNEARLEIGMGGFGLGAAAYLSALGYARERLQGAHYTKVRDRAAPRVPIIEHPDIRRMLLHMKSLIDGIRSMQYAVATYIDLATHAEDPQTRERYALLVDLLTPICKAYGSDMGFRVNEIAIQVYGGYGYCQEYPVEQYCRDNKISSIYEGTNGIQALDLVGRKIVGTGGACMDAFTGLLEGFIDEHRENPAVGPLTTKLDAAKNELLKITRLFIETMPADPSMPLLWAVPYQEMLGHVASAYYLLDGAAVASKKLEEIKKLANTNDEVTLARENSEAAFYHGRIASARFFTRCILPQVYALSSTITSGDRSALEVTFPD